MNQIESEHKFIWKFIFGILLTPITLIQILFRKKGLGDLFKPFSDFFRFLVQPKFTITIIVINIVAFIVSFTLISPEMLNNLINYPSHLIEFKWYSLITSGFLHANPMHLIGNMVGIFIFGRVVERRLGSAKTALIFFGALIISNTFTSVIHLFFMGDNIGGLGASGALMGLVSAAILLDPFYLTYELLLPLPIMFVGWMAIYADIIGVLNPLEDGIGHFAHIGGFISIAILTFLLNIEHRKQMKKGLLINIASLAVGVLIYVFVI